MKNIKTLSYFIISMIVFGTLGWFVRNVPLASGEIALYRAIMAIILVGTYLLITKQKIEFKKIKKEIPLLILSGIAMGINWVLLFEAYNYTTVTVATLSYYFAPVIVMILCPILFKEKMTLKQIICFIASSIGLVLVMGITNIGKEALNLKGIGLGLGAACFYATVILINKFIKNIDGIQRTFIQFISSLIVLIPYVLLTSGINIVSLQGSELIYLLIIGLIHTGVSYCLYFSSLKELSGQKVSILSYIDPLVAILVSYFLLSETITLPQILGGILIIIFTLFNEISIKKTPKNIS
ncbi:MAG: EamA family transporter [Bacilli bacterium]|nr:EamA family transporter [Bacilli bacterium]